MTDQQTFAMTCKGCNWSGELASSASDKCPRCANRLQLAPKASRSIMRDAVNKALTPKAAEPVLIQRALRDKDAPRDEGEWEFKLKDGVLEVIAWNDEKNEAQCIRLVRRGTQILLMQTQKPEGEE